MATRKTTKTTEIEVMEIQRGEIGFCLRGDSPLICNAMSLKAMQQLLLPPKRKNAAEKASTLKHDPLEEYRASIYRMRDPRAPTRIAVLSTMVKGAMVNAALDLPGTTKTQIGRLSYVVGDQLAVYGVPQLMMSVVRSADINKTPDVRTRAILPEWCLYAKVQFTKPLLNEKAIVNLLAAAGVTNGLGDWRIGKGSGSYGAFSLVDQDDADYQRIMKTGGKDAQDAALENPVAYDSETEQLLTWFGEEVHRRGLKAVA